MTKPLYVRNIPLGDEMPQICVPLTGNTISEITSQAERAAAAGADLIEWWMDRWKEPCSEDSLEEALFKIAGAAPETPRIFTIRTKEEGGSFENVGDEYERLNQIAAGSGRADMIDVEYLRDPETMKPLIQKLKSLGVCTIASTHDFDKTDDEETLLSKYRMMDESGADVLKMAVMPHGDSDTQRLIECTRIASSEITEKPVIAMAMGSEGTRSRIEGETFGSCVTFGTLDQASAPGQLPVAELREKIEEVHRHFSL